MPLLRNWLLPLNPSHIKQPVEQKRRDSFALNIRRNKIMNNTLKILALGVLTIFLLAGCGKQQTEEINAAKASVDAVIAEGAQKFAAEDAKNLNDSLQAAQDELKVQEGKTFKDYAKAKELFAKAKADADALKAGLPAKKEEAKKNAVAA